MHDLDNALDNGRASAYSAIEHLLLHLNLITGKTSRLQMIYLHQQQSGLPSHQGGGETGPGLAQGMRGMESDPRASEEGSANECSTPLKRLDLTDPPSSSSSGCKSVGPKGSSALPNLSKKRSMEVLDDSDTGGMHCMHTKC